jgi:SanA protein
MLKPVMYVGLAAVAFVLSCDIWVSLQADRRIFKEVQNLPVNNVGLVLGTSQYLKGGRTNLFFTYRMDAAAALYHQGKVKHLIVSGDNGTRYYDEASAMREALLKRGVPDSAITRDYAGFRTLDSVIRCREIFGQEKFTIVSQAFHNKRALFIAHAKGMDAIAFNAPSVSRKYAPRTYFREYFARVKAVLDVYLLNTQPRFLGERIDIQVG